MRICDLKKKEVINICDCRRLGFVTDLEFEPDSGCITHLIVPGQGCLCGIFGHEKEYVIPYTDVKQIGNDIILVEIRKLKEVEKNIGV
jgi:YlmC/YmxH family sporulation protein